MRMPVRTITASVAGLALLAVAGYPVPSAAKSHAPAPTQSAHLNHGGSGGAGAMGGSGAATCPGMTGQAANGRGAMGRGAAMGRSAMGRGARSHGMRVMPSLNVTTKDVRRFMEKLVKRMGHKRLKVGAIKKIDDNTITADLVTVDDSLVQRFTIDRNDGWMRRAD